MSDVCRIRLMFELSGGALWGGNAATRAKHGVGWMGSLPISDASQNKIKELEQWLQTAARWEQSRDPLVWSAEERNRFDIAAIDLQRQIQSELGSGYDVVYEPPLKLTRSHISALGGISNEERAALRQHYQLWQNRSLRTDPIDQNSIVPAIKALYHFAGLSTPRIILVPSPGALVFAGAFASEIWKRRIDDPRYLSTATEFETIVHNFTDCSLLIATLKATMAAITPTNNINRHESSSDVNVGYVTRMGLCNGALDATSDSTDEMTLADVASEEYTLQDLGNAFESTMKDDYGRPLPTPLISAAIQQWAQALAMRIFPNAEDSDAAINGVPEWYRYADSGNAQVAWDWKVTAFRDILGLNLPEHEDYAIWEQCAIHGSLRYMHPEFCILSDFPCEVSQEESSNLPGRGLRNYKWRDGWQV